MVALTACLRVFPAEETFGDKLVYGVANLSLRLKNNLFNRGESFGEFQMIRQEAFTRLADFERTSLPLKTPICSAGYPESEKL